MKIGPVEQDWTAFSTLEAQILNFVCGRVLHEVPPVKNRLSEEADRITVTCLDNRFIGKVLFKERCNCETPDYSPYVAKCLAIRR